MKKPLLLILGVCLITVIVIFLGWEEIVSSMSMMTVSEMVLMALLQLATLLMTAFIWYSLLKQKTDSISFPRVFSINLSGKFVESVTPSVKIGGESLKMYLMRKHSGLPYDVLLAVTVVSKFYSLLPFLLISVVTLAFAVFSFNLPAFVYMALLGLAIFFGLFALFFNYGSSSKKLAGVLQHIGIYDLDWFIRIREKVNRIHKFILNASESSRNLITTPGIKSLLYTTATLVWVMYPVKVLLVAHMMGYNLNLSVVIVATYTAYLVSMIPLLPGGLATFEGSMAFVLAMGSITAPKAFSIALMTRMFTFWFPLLLSALITILFIPIHEWRGNTSSQ